MNPTPRIVCAANRFIVKISPTETEELIIAGSRHWDSVMRGVWEALDEFYVSCIDRGSEEQGFIDQFGNFYSRKAAFVVAKQNNQIIRDLGYETNELFSEHLY